MSWDLSQRIERIPKRYGITLGGRTSGIVNLVGLQNRVAKNLQNFFI